MDGTGPIGLGPGTGGGYGRCAGGRRFGRGRMFSGGYYDAPQGYSGRRTAYEPEEETGRAQEKDRVDSLFTDLSQIRERAAALEDKLSELTNMVKKLADSKQSEPAKTTKPR
jgi:hypothetical protein